MKKRKGLSMRRREIITGFIFISPWLVGIVYIFIKNMAQAIRFSFNELNILEEGGYVLTNVGLSNFRFLLFEEVLFNRELVNSIFVMLVDVPLIIFFSLFMALLLNRKFMLRGLVRAIFFLPVIMATPAITNVLAQLLVLLMGGITVLSPEMERAQSLFNPRAIAMLLSQFGMPIPIIIYLMDAIGRLYETIRSAGVQILIFLAALQAIPSSLYEVAHIEGATGYESFWKITFPMVSPLILTNVIYTIVDTYQRSDIAQLIYDTAFRQTNFGLSSSMSVISTIVTCLILLIVGTGVSRYVYYQN